MEWWTCYIEPASSQMDPEGPLETFPTHFSHTQAPITGDQFVPWLLSHVVQLTWRAPPYGRGMASGYQRVYMVHLGFRLEQPAPSGAAMCLPSLRPLYRPQATNRGGAFLQSARCELPTGRASWSGLRRLPGSGDGRDGHLPVRTLLSSHGWGVKRKTSLSCREVPTPGGQLPTTADPAPRPTQVMHPRPLGSPRWCARTSTAPAHR